MQKRDLAPRKNYMFQSAPGREAGRCGTGSPSMTACGCFNPRPAVRPGDAEAVEIVHHHVLVSIRARP